MIKLQRYNNKNSNDWDKVVYVSDNSHFMFLRNYMDYHADRFNDHSFFITLEEEIIGVIPGNAVDSTWYSHQGLTFGGIILNPKYNRVLLIQQIIKQLVDNLKNEQFTKMVYKFIPNIYHQRPCDADMYVLSQYELTKDICEVSSVITLNNLNKFSDLRIRGRKKADKTGFKYSGSTEWQECWAILTNNLQKKYNKMPVHTLDEILLLSNNFPENIKLYTAVHDDFGVCAGVVIYETHTVAHCQYITANDFGLQKNALDGLFAFLIDYYASTNKKFFNFGISTENAGQYLNENLIQFKEGFGARSIVHITKHFLLC